MDIPSSPSLSLPFYCTKTVILRHAATCLHCYISRSQRLQSNMEQLHLIVNLINWQGNKMEKNITQQQKWLHHIRTVVSCQPKAFVVLFPYEGTTLDLKYKTYYKNTRHHFNYTLMFCQHSCMFLFRQSYKQDIRLAVMHSVDMLLQMNLIFAETCNFLRSSTGIYNHKLSGSLMLNIKLPPNSE